MTKSKKIRYIIYELSDDTKNWFYIGCTSRSLEKRLSGHRSTSGIRDKYPGINPDNLIIRELAVINTANLDDAHRIEEQITLKYHDKYGNRLLNSRCGDNHKLISGKRPHSICKLRKPKKDNPGYYSRNPNKHVIYEDTGLSPKCNYIVLHDGIYKLSKYGKIGEPYLLFTPKDQRKRYMRKSIAKGGNLKIFLGLDD